MDGNVGGGVEYGLMKCDEGDVSLILSIACEVGCCLIDICSLSCVSVSSLSMVTRKQSLIELLLIVITLKQDTVVITLMMAGW